MFKAFIANWDDIPGDVNRNVFVSGEADLSDDYLYDNYLVVQVDGTIYCKPESEFDDDMKMTTELMELAYYLGVVAGVKHEQNYMEGRNLRGLDDAKRLRPGKY